MTIDFDAPVLADLRRRRSAKWQLHDADVLPLWVAELDVPLAEPVAAALHDAVERGDTGYAAPAALAGSFARFAERRWSWQVERDWCWPVPDVMTGVGEVLKVLTAPGQGVVICPPVYHPFFEVPAAVGRSVVQVPLTTGGDLDLDGIDRALGAGARAVLLCSPHNPTGRVWTEQELDDLDAVVRPHAAVVVSDEVHAPLTLPPATFTPYLRRRERRAVALVSASKAFNLAGLKAALAVAGDEETQSALRAIPPDVAWHVGHFGVIAGIAAFDRGDDWLDGLLRHLDRNRVLVGELLADHLPGVGYTAPQASFLAWLDCGAIGQRPAAWFLERARVALSEGADFGAQGAGFARLNFGTTAAVLTEAVQRLAGAVP